MNIPTTIQQFLKNNFAYNIQGLLYLTASLISLIIGLTVLLKGIRSKIHIWFFFITFFGSIWLFMYSLIHFSTNSELTYYWLGLCYLLGVPYISPSVYMFIHYWTGQKPNKPFVIFVFLGAFALGLSMFLLTNQISSFELVYAGRFNFFRQTTIGLTYYIVMVLFFSGVAIYSVRLLFLGMKNHPSAHHRTEYRNFFIATGIGYLGSIDFLTGIGLPIYPVGYIAFTVFILLIFYTIIRHKFLNIDLTYKRFPIIILIYALLLTLLIPIVVPFLYGSFGSPIITPFKSLLFMGLLTGGVFSLGPFIYANLVKESFWLKGNLSTGLTHELKSPLGVIQNATEIALAALNSPTPDTNKVRDYLSMVEQNTMRLNGYVKNLLDIALIQEGAVTINRKNFDLTNLLEKVIHNYHDIADQKNITIESSLMPAPLYADEEKLEQAFSNILGNALKYSNGGIVKITLSIEKSTCLVSVADNGIGIPKGHLSRVFERFYQANTAQKGSGIGLAIAKAWVEAHDGKIWAESEGEGKGTKVTFTLPAAS